jgi:hypothetical protein
MVRVEDLNITFFHLPKNAGSSIAIWLTDNVGGEEYHNELRHATPVNLKPLFNDFGWSFCCVRNPWDRVVSWYNFFKEQRKIFISFEEYMDCVINNDWSGKYIRPITPQCLTINDKDVDYIIKYENLIEDFKVVQNKVNCYEPLSHINKANYTKHADYYAKDKYINWIAEYYAEEIASLDYSFGE